MRDGAENTPDTADTADTTAPGAPSRPNDVSERHVLEYLERIAAGETLDLEAFLATVPRELRDECRDHIEATASVRTAIRGTGKDAGETTRDPDGSPRISGFRVERLLGEGGVGRVHAAWDEALHRRVALKTLKQGTPDAVRERILGEARHAAGLRDPAIVTIYSVVDSGETPAVVMEYVEGYPIDKATKGLSFKQKARILRAVARGLAVAHAQGIIHRDLKPGNILVTPELEPRILDFGLAVPSRAEHQREGWFEGTPHFASPEQARREKVTPASDVFSFGILMFKVLTGELPFPGVTLTEVLDGITKAAPPFPRSLAADVPEDLQAICLACLAREPHRRPRAAEVAAELGRYLAREPSRLRPALYGDILQRRIAEHVQDLESWRRQGMLAEDEGDRLERVYRRVLADEDYWIIDARKLSLPQTVIYTGAWMAVLAPLLMVWLARDELSPWARWLLPLLGSAALLSAGLLAHARREVLASAAFLAAAVLSVAPAALSALGEAQALALPPEGVAQLLDAFTNEQLLCACASSLVLSLFAFSKLRLTGFAWTTACLTVATYLSFLLTRGFLDLKPDARAASCLPLALLEAAALVCERLRRVRWALPFHAVAIVTLVAALDAIAVQGPTLTRLGLDSTTTPYLDPSRLEAFSLALNGLVFLAAMTITERARSLDLRFASRIFEVLVPIHLLGALYSNARDHAASRGLWLDVSAYVASVLLMLLLCPWRSRRRLLLGGLAGVALGSHLLVDLALVPRPAFLIALGIVGLAASIATYVYLRRKAAVRAP